MDNRKGREKLKTTSSRSRRGSLYLPVLSTCLIASLLAGTVLLVVRTRRLTLEQHQSEQQSRLHSLAALASARQRIATDPSWRSLADSGRVRMSFEFDRGFAEVEIYDPHDDDVTDDPSEAYVIRAIGKAGTAQFISELPNQEQSNRRDALHSSLSVGGALSINSSSLGGSGSVWATGAIAATASQVDVDVASAGDISGSGYMRARLSNQAMRAALDPDQVYAQLAPRATIVDSLGTTRDTGDISPNAGFESDDEPWENKNESGQKCKIRLSTTTPRTGSQCLQVYDRGWYSHSATLPIDFFEIGRSYDLVFWVRNSSSSNLFRICVAYKRSGSSSWIREYSNYKNVGTTWTELNHEFSPTGSGTITECVIRLETFLLQAVRPFFIDDVEIFRLSPAPQVTNVLLSPLRNPYGSLNPEGIYLYDCGGEDVMIRNCRIRATLLLKDPGPNSEIGPGPICWDPASPALPALVISRSQLTQGASIKISLNGTSLTELAIGENLNPTGDPHPDGSVDSFRFDRYPCRINGALLIDGSVNLTGVHCVDELMVVTGNMSLNGKLSLSQSRYLERFGASWIPTQSETVTLGTGLQIVQ